MRDPNRIPIILDAIKELWETMPDMRLGQLVYCIMSSFPYDYFQVEDDKFMEALDNFKKKMLANKLSK